MSINKDIFLHESDKAALDALESLPGFAQVTKAFIKAFNEKMLDVQNMSTNIRITDKQLKKYHDMLIPICKKLDIEVPDLYLTLNVMPNAYTSGDDKPCIVLTSGMDERLKSSCSCAIRDAPDTIMANSQTRGFFIMLLFTFVEHLVKVSDGSGPAEIYQRHIP